MPAFTLVFVFSPRARFSLWLAASLPAFTLVFALILDALSQQIYCCPLQGTNSTATRKVNIVLPAGGNLRMVRAELSFEDLQRTPAEPLGILPPAARFE